MRKACVQILGHESNFRAVAGSAESTCLRDFRRLYSLCSTGSIVLLQKWHADCFIINHHYLRLVMEKCLNSLVLTWQLPLPRHIQHWKREYSGIIYIYTFNSSLHKKNKPFSFIRRACSFYINFNVLYSSFQYKLLRIQHGEL